mmetsp:Transcript_43097/g.121894  ORF Transcript_43097/g.121894 Transcript_43097/m.121894 type:complete len:202 (-) Transcript_43097:259-864(-)
MDIWRAWPFSSLRFIARSPRSLYTRSARSFSAFFRISAAAFFSFAAFRFCCSSIRKIARCLGFGASSIVSIMRSSNSHSEAISFSSLSVLVDSSALPTVDDSMKPGSSVSTSQMPSSRPRMMSPTTLLPTCLEVVSGSAKMCTVCFTSQELTPIFSHSLKEMVPSLSVSRVSKAPHQVFRVMAALCDPATVSKRCVWPWCM